MSAYYNEIDPFAAAWLRELIADGQIAPGDVDERSIWDVPASDLVGYRQCHFFAGIGGWSLALRLAGWPDDRPVWTGSCPCQPFSSAGRRTGLADERHVWPAFHWLIQQGQPPVVFGEQVDAAIRFGWIDLVRDDLAGIGYTFGVVDLPAACVGAPHIRQRLWWVAEPDGRAQGEGRSAGPGETDRWGTHGRLAGSGASSELADREGLGLSHGGTGKVLAEPRASSRDTGELADVSRERRRPDGSNGGRGEARWLANADGVPVVGLREEGRRTDGAARVSEWSEGARGELVDADDTGSQGRIERGNRAHERAVGPTGVVCGLPGFWSRAEWLLCRDGKARPVEPGIFPLAHGVSGRVAVVRPGVKAETAIQEEIRWVSRAGALSGAGNAIVPQVAAAFIAAYLDTKKGEQ